MFQFVPDRFITIKICKKTVSRDPCWLSSVPDRFKTQEICEQAFKEDNWLFVPDYFVTDEMLKSCKDEEWLRSY